MLGLGDIVSWLLRRSTCINVCKHTHTTQVLPGLLLCFAMRFDCECAKSGGRGGSTHSLNHFLTKCVLFCQKCSYFSVTLVGYATGWSKKLIIQFNQSAFCK